MRVTCDECGHEWEAVDVDEDCPGCNMPLADELTDEEIEQMWQDLEMK